MFGSVRSQLYAASVVALTLLITAPPARALVYGVDVSNNNGTENWALFAGEGKQFAWAKATQGTDFEDGDFSANESNATANGVLIGAYDFADPVNNTPSAEANYFYNFANQYGAFGNGKLIPALDLEQGLGDTVEGASSLAQWAIDWCQDVKTLTGVTPCIYCNQSYAQSLVASDSAIKSYPLWIAAYETTPETGGWTYTFLQYNDADVLPGNSSTFIDVDDYGYSLSQLVSDYAIGGVAPAGMIVPEPGCLALVLGLGIASLSRRRRQIA